MPNDRTIRRREQSILEDTHEVPNAERSPLLEVAETYAQVAREAREDCERGVSAQEQLSRRRNASGQ
jgi:ribosome-binding protein aMBF1 (putative translation factor)